jgi:NDP-sugar pyrophosphorylase family protein
MMAVILVGGLGTRLRPLTSSVPKPLLCVGERPILEIIIERLKRYGIDDLVLATGYQAEAVRALCGDGSRFGVTIRYVHEEKPLGTAGPLSLARTLLSGEELFLVMNGDIITDLDFSSFVDAARTGGCDLTVACTNHVYRSPYGVLRLDGGAVVGVEEKPEQTFTVSAGLYCLRAGALELVPDGQFFTIPDLMNRLIAAGRRIEAYRIDGLWVTVENITDLPGALDAVKRLES